MQLSNHSRKIWWFAFSTKILPKWYRNSAVSVPSQNEKMHLSYRSSSPEVFCKKVFLKISQYSQDKTCPGVSFLSKLQAWGLQLYWKRLSHRCFPMNFAIFLRTPFYIKHLWWLLLKLLFNYISIISST